LLDLQRDFAEAARPSETFKFRFTRSESLVSYLHAFFYESPTSEAFWLMRPAVEMTSILG
jgi:hypothetical protein